MKLPDQFHYSSLYGYDLILICTGEALQEKLDFLGNNPAGKDWTRFSYLLSGTCSSRSKKGSYRQLFENGDNGNYGKVQIRQVGLDYSGKSAEPLYGIHLEYTCIGSALQSDCQASFSNYVSYTPPLPNNNSVYTLKTALQPVPGEQGRTCLQVDQEKTVSYYKEGPPAEFWAAWRKLKPLQLGFGLRLNHAADSMPLEAAHWFFDRNPEELMLWLGVNDQKQIPARVPMGMQLKKWMRADSPCSLVIGTRSLMSWLLPKIAAVMQLDLTKLPANAEDGEIRFRVPYPIRFADGTVASYERAQANVNEADVSIWVMKDRDNAFCQLRIELPALGGFTGKEKYTYCTYVEFGFSRQIINQELMPEVKVGNAGGAQSRFEKAIEQAFAQVAMPANSKRKLFDPRVFRLPESDQFFYKQMRLNEATLVLSATPKY